MDKKTRANHKDLTRGKVTASYFAVCELLIRNTNKVISWQLKLGGGTPKQHGQQHFSVLIGTNKEDKYWKVIGLQHHCKHRMSYEGAAGILKQFTFSFSNCHPAVC